MSPKYVLEVMQGRLSEVSPTLRHSVRTYAFIRKMPSSISVIIWNWAQAPALPCASCVALGTFLNLSEPGVKKGGKALELSHRLAVMLKLKDVRTVRGAPPSL